VLSWPKTQGPASRCWARPWPKRQSRRPFPSVNTASTYPEPTVNYRQVEPFRARVRPVLVPLSRPRAAVEGLSSRA
jgi:hypothetical protein